MSKVRDRYDPGNRAADEFASSKRQRAVQEHLQSLHAMQLADWLRSLGHNIPTAWRWRAAGEPEFHPQET